VASFRAIRFVVPSDLETLAAMLLDEEIREQNAARERQYERAAQHRERAALIERMMGIAKEHAKEPLTSTDSTHNLDNMASPIVGSANLSRGIAASKNKKHPFVRVLYSRGMTVSEWARSKGIPVATASSWVSSGDGKRRIPIRYAKAIEAEFGIPATAATWRNGITTD
jgi:hypothetical protein